MQFSGPIVSAVQTEAESSAKNGAGERVALVLGGESRKQFLPRLESLHLPTEDFRWVDLSTLDAASWERCLLEWQPTVLVTSWGSPAIPANLARSSEWPLRYVCHLTGSVRQIVPRELIERGALVSNWGTSVSGAVAEHAMLLVLAALRGVSEWKTSMALWPGSATSGPKTMLTTQTLRGKRVGLHGFGSIARELVSMLRPFGARLAAYSQGVPESFFVQHGVQSCPSLAELFATSDVLIECEALTPLTKGTVDASILRRLPEGAVFVNVGRGYVVDEAVLVQIAREKKLRLGLDVYQQEPLPASSPLHSLPRTLLSPHIAGPTTDGFGDLCEFALANLKRYLAGEPLKAQVTLEIYDRAT